MKRETLRMQSEVVKFMGRIELERMWVLNHLSTQTLTEQPLPIRYITPCKRWDLAAKNTLPNIRGQSRERLWINHPKDNIEEIDTSAAQVEAKISKTLEYY